MFIKSGKDFSTEFYFFEKNGNTVITNGIKDNFIETKFFKKQGDRRSCGDRTESIPNLKA